MVVPRFYRDAHAYTQLCLSFNKAWLIENSPDGLGDEGQTIWVQKLSPYFLPDFKATYLTAVESHLNIPHDSDVQEGAPSAELRRRGLVGSVADTICGSNIEERERCEAN